MTGRGVLLLATLLFVVAVPLGQLTAYDIWAILAGGRYILTNGLPVADPFSFTASGQPWVNQMWLTQVVFYWVYATLGRDPLILLKVVVVAATLGLVWWSAVHRSGSASAASLVTALVAVAGAPWWHLRPQILTYLCLAGTLALLDAWRSGRRGAIWGVPAIMAVWVNAHAGFMIGFAILAIWWVGSLIERVQGRGLSAASGSFKTLAVATGLTAIASLANPYGLRIFTFPLKMTGSQFALETSVDWYSPNFLAPAMIPALAMIVLLFAALGLSGRRLGPTDLLLLAALFASSLRSGRNIPLFLIASAPLLAEMIVALIRPLQGRRLRIAAIAPAGLTVLLLLGTGLVGWSLRAPARNPFLQELNEKRYPIEVAQFFKTYRPPPQLFNVFLWAGYELWALPEYKVFIDNRFELYPESVFRDYLGVTYVTPRWEEILNRWGIRTLIVGRDSALAQVLQSSGRWGLILVGREAAVYVKLGDPLADELLSRLGSAAGGVMSR